MSDFRWISLCSKVGLWQLCLENAPLLRWDELLGFSAGGSSCALGGSVHMLLRKPYKSDEFWLSFSFSQNCLKLKYELWVLSKHF